MISRVIAMLIATTDEDHLFIATLETEEKWESALYLKEPNMQLRRLLFTDNSFNSSEEARGFIEKVCTWCKNDFLTNEINEVHINLVNHENE